MGKLKYMQSFFSISNRSVSEYEHALRIIWVVFKRIIFVIYRTVKDWVTKNRVDLPVRVEMGCNGYLLVNNIVLSNLVIPNMNFYISSVIKKGTDSFVFVVEWLDLLPIEVFFGPKSRETMRKHTIHGVHYYFFIVFYFIHIFKLKQYP